LKVYWLLRVFIDHSMIARIAARKSEASRNRPSKPRCSKLQPTWRTQDGRIGNSADSPGALDAGNIHLERTALACSTVLARSTPTPFFRTEFQ
jgi:hypothetical protein